MYIMFYMFNFHYLQFVLVLIFFKFKILILYYFFKVLLIYDSFYLVLDILRKKVTV